MCTWKLQCLQARMFHAWHCYIKSPPKSLHHLSTLPALVVEATGKRTYTCNTYNILTTTETSYLCNSSCVHQKIWLPFCLESMVGHRHGLRLKTECGIFYVNYIEKWKTHEHDAILKSYTEVHHNTWDHSITLLICQVGILFVLQAPTVLHYQLLNWPSSAAGLSQSQELQYGTIYLKTLSLH